MKLSEKSRRCPKWGLVRPRRSIARPVLAPKHALGALLGPLFRQFQKLGGSYLGRSGTIGPGPEEHTGWDQLMDRSSAT